MNILHKYEVHKLQNPTASHYEGRIHLTTTDVTPKFQ